MAISDFTSALALKEDAVAYYYRGRVLRTRTRVDEAISDFSAAIDLKPDYAGAFYYRGRSRKSQGLTGAAISDFRAVLNITEDNSYIERAKSQIEDLE